MVLLHNVPVLGLQQSACEDFWTFDLRANHWTKLAAPAPALRDHVAALDGAELVLQGGQNAEGEAVAGTGFMEVLGWLMVVDVCLESFWFYLLYFICLQRHCNDFADSACDVHADLCRLCMIDFGI